MNDIKHRIIDEIEKNVDVFYKSSGIQYRIRCPICGDSQKNLKDAHCYIKCSYDPSEPLLYICFKCNSSGKVNESFLKKLGIKSDVVNLVDKQRYNKIPSVNKADVNIITGEPVLESRQAEYINKRLGVKFTVDDFDRFKIIWDMNTIYPYISDQRIKNSIPSNINSISFLSDDKSVLLTRYFGEDDPRWRKTKLFPSKSKSYYTIKSALDIFTNDDIEVNIAEGVIDVISVYKNFASNENSVFIATLGSDYAGGIEYAITKGLIGYNVIVKVYIDSDVNLNNVRFQLKKYRWIFKNIYIYMNIKSKDVGTTIDNIKLLEKKI